MSTLVSVTEHVGVGEDPLEPTLTSRVLDRDAGASTTFATSNSMASSYHSPVV